MYHQRRTSLLLLGREIRCHLRSLAVLGYCRVDCPAMKGKLMPKVIYQGNGNTGGSVPVDNTSYAAAGSFTVAGPGSLTLG